jgi:16S rRNA (cytosine967-C5)-methyltransferase
MPQPGKMLYSQLRAARHALAYLLDKALVQRLPADRVLAAYLRDHKEFGGRDRRLISESIYAVFRWWGWLRAVGPLEPLLEMAGGWDVTADRFVLGGRSLDGLPPGDADEQLADRLDLDFNQLQRARDESDHVIRAGRLLKMLGVRDSSPRMADLMPDWAIREVNAPRPADEWIAWFQKRPPLWLRIQRDDVQAVLAELKAEGLSPVQHAALPEAVRVETGAVNLYTLALYRDGGVEVQDLASQSIGAICAPVPGQRWWDPCAGGGGKSLLLARLMKGKGTVVAGDVNVRKLENLRRRARRGQFSNIRVRPWDGRAMAPDQATFDGVLVDAPCTCSGTWRRNPAARWSALPDDAPEMAAIQRGILENASSGVKRGGVLVYSTCSMFARENDAVIDDFLSRHPEYRLEDFLHPLAGTPCAGRLAIWPWDGDCDAMYAARLRRV